MLELLHATFNTTVSVSYFFTGLQWKLYFMATDKILYISIQMLVSLFLSPDIQNSLWVGWRWVHGESGGIQSPWEQLQGLCSGAALACCGWRAGWETGTSRMDVAPVQDDQTGQQQGLVVVVVMRAPSHASGQQDATLPLVVEHQGQQSHHQDEDDSTADDSVSDAGVVAQTVVECHKVLARGFCKREGKEIKSKWMMM